MNVTQRPEMVRAKGHLPVMAGTLLFIPAFFSSAQRPARRGSHPRTNTQRTENSRPTTGEAGSAPNQPRPGDKTPAGAEDAWQAVVANIHQPVPRFRGNRPGPQIPWQPDPPNRAAGLRRQ